MYFCCAIIPGEVKKKNQEKNKGGSVFTLLVLTLLLLFLLTQLPTLQWRGFSTKPVDLFSDIRVDEALLDLPGDGEWQEEMDEIAEPQPLPRDTVIIPDTVIPQKSYSNREGVVLLADSINTIDPPRVDEGITLFEDFSENGDGLSHLLAALQNDTLNRPVRIGFLGDSFIEADIFTQDVRALLQEQYGGRGVGYVSMYSDFPGFRRSVIQSGGGWRVHSVLNPKEVDWNVMTIQQQYFIPLSGAKASYKGTARVAHADRWSNSRFIFLAPQDCSVSLKTDSGGWRRFAVTGSPDLQSLSLSGETSSFSVQMDSIPSFTAVGVWLDDEQGVAVDNISTRGYSGLSLSSISSVRSAQLNALVPYDAIVLQYGLNIITPEIYNYEAYARKMVRVIRHLQSALPHTDIILMGVGDRCQKINGTLTTMPAILGLVKAQRMAARTAGVVFWDTYRAMGGKDGILDYVARQEANKDYTHINHKGGRRLAAEFVKSLQYVIGL